MDASRNRKSIRLRGYDYSRPGAYFVSICTKDRKCLFGDIENQVMALNDAGRMVNKWYVELENKFQDIRCNEYIIMPNHFHAIIKNIGTNPVGADLCVCPDDLNIIPGIYRRPYGAFNFPDYSNISLIIFNTIEYQALAEHRI